jgi:hypothetical protein
MVSAAHLPQCLLKQLLSPLKNHLTGFSAKSGQDSSLKTETRRREVTAIRWEPLIHPGLKLGDTGKHMSSYHGNCHGVPASPPSRATELARISVSESGHQDLFLHYLKHSSSFTPICFSLLCPLRWFRLRVRLITYQFLSFHRPPSFFHTYFRHFYRYVVIKRLTILLSNREIQASVLGRVSAYFPQSEHAYYVPHPTTSCLRFQDLTFWYYDEGPLRCDAYILVFEYKAFGGTRCLHLLLWRWWQQVLPKQWYPNTKPYDIILWRIWQLIGKRRLKAGINHC